MSDNTAQIRDALDNPQPAPQLVQEGAMPDARSLERPPFPPGCPVKPLGIDSSILGSQTCFYLNSNGQPVGLEAGTKHGKNALIALFGAKSDWLEEHFPQWSAPKYEGRGKERRLVKRSEIIGFDQAEASRALIEECCRKGIFSAMGKLKGVGAHRINVSGLALHCGDKILTTDHRADGSIKKWTWIDPGVHCGSVYAAKEKVPRPIEHEVGNELVRELVKLLITWNWRRPLVDPRLLLGAIGASMLGGALGWRPNIWITGGRGTGKSTLNGKEGVLHQLFGEYLFRTGNASSAALRQTLLNSTVPVMIDELEAGEDNRKVREIVETARLSSSGEDMHRGGSDHQPTQFTIQSVFWFSSINIMMLKPQDRSRFAILELKPIEEGKAPPNLPSFNLPLIGRHIMRRMIDGWERLDAVKHKYHEALIAVGHDNRACDQFGTLLACAHILLDDGASEDGLPSDEDVALWADRCRPQRLKEVREADADHEQCLNHLLSTTVQARGGDEREEVASWIGDALAFATAPLLQQQEADVKSHSEKAADRLSSMGLKLVNAVYHDPVYDPSGTLKTAGRFGSSMLEADEPGFLAIANSHAQLEQIYNGSEWPKIWSSAVSRYPGAIEGVKVKFGKKSLTAVLVPLHHVLDDDELPAASRAAGFGEWQLELEKRQSESA